jgi:hypothetical protein
MEMKKKKKLNLKDLLLRRKKVKFKPTKEIKNSDNQPIRPEVEIPWYHFYKKNGFKRITGFFVGLFGIAVKFIPEYEAIGELIFYLGGALGIGGSIHGKIKNNKTNNKTQIIKQIIIWIWGQITKLMNKKKEQ